MISEQLSLIVSSYFTMAGLWVLYFCLYKRFRVDVARQKMFVLRDQLFDEAADGLISFDHPAYGTLRRTMNGYIRFAHRLDLLQAICFLFSGRKYQDLLENEENSFEKRMEKVTRELPEDVRERLAWYRNQIYKQILVHCVSVSFFLSLFIMLLALPLLAVAILVSGLRRSKLGLKWVLNRNINNIESSAYAIGRT